MVPVAVKVSAMERGVLQVHIVVAGQAKDLRGAFQEKDAFQDLVLLLEDPPGPDGCVPVFLCPFQDIAGQFLAFREVFDEIVQIRMVRTHAVVEARKVSLQLPVPGRHLFRVERPVDQVAGDDIGLGIGQGEKFLDLRKGAVDVGKVDDLHGNALIAV